MKTPLKKMKVVWAILLLFFITSLITGCGFKDIDKRMFVVGVGVDKSNSEEKPYKITLKMTVLSGGTKTLLSLNILI